MAINYGDLECSPFMIARAEREADARLDACDLCGGIGHRPFCELLEGADDADERAEYERAPDIWDLQDMQEDN